MQQHTTQQLYFLAFIPETGVMFVSTAAYKCLHQLSHRDPNLQTFQRHLSDRVVQQAVAPTDEILFNKQKGIGIDPSNRWNESLKELL